MIAMKQAARRRATDKWWHACLLDGALAAAIFEASARVARTAVILLDRQRSIHALRGILQAIEAWYVVFACIADKSCFRAAAIRQSNPSPLRDLCKSIKACPSVMRMEAIADRNRGRSTRRQE